ncbi:hypothetical protein Csa_014683 [Cucumis sativus]|uniref:Uncharacterized protein n=1 Tax=Cucumis sativus TaxID=3659 RepID=A0A0A0KTS9_CUCSA|nr:hypothetical protein Csa_014683 [Cucumis sativus]
MEAEAEERPRRRGDNERNKKETGRTHVGLRLRPTLWAAFASSSSSSSPPHPHPLPPPFITCGSLFSFHP